MAPEERLEHRLAFNLGVPAKTLVSQRWLTKPRKGQMAAHMTQEQRRTRLGDEDLGVDQADRTELLYVTRSIAFEPLDLVIDER